MLDELLAVFGSFGVATVPVKTGLVPTVVASGVTGTWTVLLVPAAIGPALTQGTVWPLVVHVHGPSVKLAGALVPAGIVIVAVIGPVVEAVPMFATVIG